MKTRSIITGLAVSLLALAWGCSTVDHRLGVERGAEPGPFVSAPDDSGAPDASVLFTNYCPSNQCPPGHTTCPSSQFRCDVDLLTDLNNCGECGNACPRGSGSADYACVGGRCVMNCKAGYALDCDGVPDNGCETSPLSNDHCGYCGNKCPLDKPCLQRGISELGCGCKPGELECPGGFLPCVDPSTDDANCGACGNACPPEGDGSEEAPSNTFFGCRNSECGALKCSAGWGNCDGSIDNGCESSLTTDDNCGACGNKCQNGMKCALNQQFLPECMCPAGQTFCESGRIGDLDFGYCADLAWNKDACGACGNRCENDITNANEACVYGKCDWSCNAGWGDCNGNRDDGCETNISADPKNCGGCGIVCDGVAGQACVDGQCMVEPCDETWDAGDPAR